jgi:AhpD family alkylhydroperoxidase
MREEDLRQFVERREHGNQRVLDTGNLSIRRFFALDHDVYADGAVSRKEKELMGLVGSAVLRCDDCISYHLRELVACGATRDEVVEALAVALVVGGSIIIPHLRHAFSFLDLLLGIGSDGGRRAESSSAGG